MAIKIKAVKEVDTMGKWGYRVKSVSALRQDEVPDLYLKQSLNCYEEKSIDGKKQIKVNAKEKTYSLREEEFYTENEFNNLIELIKQCGEKLKEINLYLKINREMWFGEIEIEI